MRIDTDKAGLKGARVLCAVSGGADSVALLRLLCDCRDRGELTLYAAHMEHGIRGEESLGDMEFTRELCREWKVPLTVERVKVPEEAAKCGEGTESCARRLRHDFLERTRKAVGADFIALAHHSRDRAETVLMHLLRGGGLKGAAAMPEKSGYLVRPLIEESPEELRAYLRSIGQSWREDATNAEADNPRNALRLEVLPGIRRIYPGAEAALGRFARLAGEEDALLDRLTDEYMKARVTCRFGAYLLEDGEKALMRRAVRRILPEADFEDVRRALTCVGRADLNAGNRAFGSGDGKVYLLPRMEMPPDRPLNTEGETRLPGICRAMARVCEAQPIRDNGLVQTMNAACLEGAVLRLRRDGDFIRPLGMGGKKKSLGDYLTDRKLPLPFRERQPVAAAGNEILWVPGVGLSETAKVMDGLKTVKIRILDGGKDHA